MPRDLFATQAPRQPRDLFAAAAQPPAQPHQSSRQRMRQTLEGDATRTPVDTRSLAEIGQSYLDVGKGVAVGAPSAALGIPGDIESLARLGLSQVAPVSRETAIPTTNEIGNFFAGEPRSQEEAAGRTIGGFVGPSGPLKLVRSAVSRAPATAQETARDLVVRALSRDKIEPENAAQVLARYPDKQLTIMDVGGSNTQRLARTVATLPGEGSESIVNFLTERAANQSARVLDDISRNLADGSDVHQVAQRLIETRGAAADPLYKAAFKANQNIASPKIDKILETPAGKAALAKARVKMQNDMTLMGVPDAELAEQVAEAGQALPFKGGVASGLRLRTLDYVKRALDDQIGAALKAGERDDVRILRDLKTKFVAALDEADVTARAGPNSTVPAGGLYKQARASFSGPSQSLEAIEEGGTFLRMPPEMLRETINALPASDRDFFRIGAARALQDRVNSAADNADAVKRVFGNARIRDQIRAVFGDDGAARFAEAMSPERMATMTNRFVQGGSNTANKLADVGDTASQIAEDAVKGLISGGPKGAVILPAMNMARSQASAFFNRMKPDVRSELAELLTRTSPNTLSATPRLPDPRTLALIEALKLARVPLGASAAASQLGQPR